MRLFNIFIVAFSLCFLTSLHAQKESQQDFYGQEFVPAPKSDISKIDEGLTVSNAVQIQLHGKITEVCQAKGCWMKVLLENNEEVFVKFKDYGFFVPTDSSEKEVVLNGMVFQETVSVNELKHYAKDRGASEAEIAKITTPKQQLRFEADGVLIRTND